MQFVEPKVFLIAETKIEEGNLDEFLTHIGAGGWDTNAPSDAEKLVEVAGKTCYMSFNTELNKNLTRVRDSRNKEYIQDGLIKVKHGSVLEHATMTFALCDVTRVMTHELVRHRVGTAFSQVSGRYVRVDELTAYKPQHLTDSENEKLGECLQVIEDMYKELEAQVFERVGTDFDTKKKVTSAIRRMLPNGQTNHIIFSCNHRSLREILEKRLHESAEEEIRLVFSKIREIVIKKYPHIYADM
jgi:thymidylate synthase (FAD)